MELFALFVALVDAVAWPAALLIVLYHVRDPLLSLLPKISRLKYRDIEFDLQKRTLQLDQEVENLPRSIESETSALELQEPQEGAPAVGDVPPVVEGAEGARGTSVETKQDLLHAFLAKWHEDNSPSLVTYANRVASVDPLRVYKEGKRRIESLIRGLSEIEYHDTYRYFGSDEDLAADLAGQGVISTSASQAVVNAITLARDVEKPDWLRDTTGDVTEEAAKNYAHSVETLLDLMAQSSRRHFGTAHA